MIASGVIVAIVSALAALFLAVRGLRGHKLSFERTAVSAVAWIIIIVGLAFVLSRMAGG